MVRSSRLVSGMLSLPLALSALACSDGEHEVPGPPSGGSSPGGSGSGGGDGSGGTGPAVGGSGGSRSGDGGTAGSSSLSTSGGSGGSAGQAGGDYGGQAGAGPGDNHSPEAPVINEPGKDGQLVSGADVHMETSAMHDADGDDHVCSDWEIWAVELDERVWRTNCITGLEKVHTHLGDGVFEGSLDGELELAPDTDYELRVRHKDSSGDPKTEWSAWSYREFHTAPALSTLPGAPGWVAMQPGFKVQRVASGLQLPVNLAFVPNASLHASDPLFYVTELYGTIKVVTAAGDVSVYREGLLNYVPSGAFPGSGEQGLSGIVVDPVSGDLFASFLYDAGSEHYPMVVRFSSADGGFTAASMNVVLDMPGESQGQSHFISNLSIGPDGKLYVHMGDGFTTETALNLDSFRGKILRMNLDGSPVPENPFYDADDGINARDYVWVYGVRNPFGGVWRQSDGTHFVVENGPSVDRFSHASLGQNFGWAGSDNDMEIGALYNWSPATGPVNVAFIEAALYSGSGYPADKHGHAFVSESGPTWASGPQADGKRISEFVLDSDNTVQGAPTPLIQYNGTGKATVAGLAAGPDGLYFTSLYQDVDFTGPTDAGAGVYRVSYAPPGDTGVLGEYFNTADLSGPSVQRQDANIAFNWFGLAPAPGLNADNFSARFTGEIHPEFSETYTFSLDADNRARLWVDDTLIVDRWTPPLGSASGTIALEADQHYGLRLEYAELTGQARVILRWQSPSQPEQIVPSERLHPPE